MKVTFTKRELAGIYLGAVSEVEVTPAADGQNPPKAITFSLAIVDAPHQEDIGQKLNFISFWLRKNDGGVNQLGINQLATFISALANEPIKNGQDFGFDTDELLQYQVTVRMEQEPYTDKNGVEKMSLKMKECWPADEYRVKAQEYRAGW